MAGHPLAGFDVREFLRREDERAVRRAKGIVAVATLAKAAADSGRISRDEQLLISATAQANGGVISPAHWRLISPEKG